ncbi:NUDIX hydrolase [Halorubrum sp. BOL3-1]|uniref:NUDIX hydrolase n=1 Tax=Halorubrum sp. BOL3-1 TaxID=2497325 RepID=UPI0010050D05|nr:NUDIX hydrolase [Halorubrum sp. BOL3-1]QAU12633.1 NUDIX hydrolase [Halorubrum sp. BOL3-1]
MVDADVPRERQTLRLPTDRIDALRRWAEEGTATAAAARVRDSDGRIALVRNAWSDGWLPPGGAVEPGESLSAAAEREVSEETGLDATIGGSLVVVEQTYVDAASDAVAFEADYVVFTGSADGTIPNADTLGAAADEIRAARWFDAVPNDLHDGDLLRPYL